MTDFALLGESLAGVHNYMPTPFLPDYSLDTDGMRNNVAFHAANFHDDMIVTVGGVYGEGDTMDLDEHKDCVSAAVDGAGGKIHVMAGVVGGYRMQRRMARNAEEAGAGSIIVFFPRIGSYVEEVAYSYLRELAESVSIGIIVFPMRDDGIWATVLERLATQPNVVGFLPGSISMGDRVNSLVPGRYLWVAENEGNAIRSFPHGCRAYTTAAPPIVPEASSKFWKHGVDGDENLMMNTFRDLVEPILRIRGLNNGGISGIKIALEMLGRSGGPVRPPRASIEESDSSVIRGILASHPEVRHLLRQC